MGRGGAVRARAAEARVHGAPRSVCVRRHTRASNGLCARHRTRASNGLCVWGTVLVRVMACVWGTVLMRVMACVWGAVLVRAMDCVRGAVLLWVMACVEGTVLLWVMACVQGVWAQRALPGVCVSVNLALLRKPHVSCFRVQLVSTEKPNNASQWSQQVHSPWSAKVHLEASLPILQDQKLGSKCDDTLSQANRQCLQEGRKTNCSWRKAI